MILSDHSLFGQSALKGEPCISVEIKPKCGFVPDSIYIADSNSIKRSVSRFEMHQALKLDQHLISEKSKYDPLALFSGSRDMIHEAVKAIYSTPQNNFRVFLNGSLVFGGLGGGTKGTNVADEEAFEDVLKCVIQADDGQRTKSFFTANFRNSL
jgi:inositol-pentakisphosphate 2-kinase